MPEKSQGSPDKPGEEAPQVSLVPDIIVISSDGKDRGNILELDDFSHTTDIQNHAAHSSDISTFLGNGSTPNLPGETQSGLSVSQVSVEVGVVKTVHAPEPFKTSSLLRGSEAHDNPADPSANKLESDNNTSVLNNSCSDSDYSSRKSSPGYASTSFSTDICDGELMELDGKSFEKTNPISLVNLSESCLDPSKADKTTKSMMGGEQDNSNTVLTVKSDMENSLRDSSPVPDVSFQVNRSRDSIDVRLDNEDEDDDGRSTWSGRSVKEGLCCCYRTFHRAFLRCVEETPTMLSGLVLSLVFCVVIIILIPTTRRNLNDHVGALAVVCVVLCLNAILLACLPWLATVRRCGGALALFVWGTLYIVAIVFFFTGGPVAAWEQVAFFLFLSLSVYTVLPLSLAWALMVGIGTSVSHIIIISVYLPVTSPETPGLTVQLVANAVLFVCVNCIGIFHKWMTEHNLRISNQKREEFSAIRSQKEIRKYQQENI